MQQQGGPLRAAEYVESKGMPSVILTDWDRKGDVLAEKLRGLLPPGSADTSVRSELSRLCRIYAKDVESMDSVVALLRADRG